MVGRPKGRKLRDAYDAYFVAAAHLDSAGVEYDGQDLAWWLRESGLAGSTDAAVKEALDGLVAACGAGQRLGNVLPAEGVRGKGERAARGGGSTGFGPGAPRITTNYLENGRGRSDMTEKFEHHDLDEDQAHAISMVRGACEELEATIALRCPPSREKSLAMAKLEECAMWANKAIAVNGAWGMDWRGR